MAILVRRRRNGKFVADLTDLTDQELLTACLWAEARGEPPQGQTAVCNVILNRVRKKMAKSVREAILAAGQFSWTDPADVNYSKVFTAETSDPNGWQRAGEVSSQALAGTLQDNTMSADHYLNVEATRRARGGTLPTWAQQGIDEGKVTVVIGHHTFLNLRG
jgi:spore germination cell wall hydrolase CwlJ-like protein